MQRKIRSDKDGLDIPIERTSLLPRAVRLYRLPRGLLIGVFLGFLLCMPLACGSDFKNKNSQTHSPNEPASTPTSTREPSPTTKAESTPVPIPPTPVPYSMEFIRRWLAQYIGFVLAGKERLAYNMLSPEVRASVSFDEFKKNSNYVLPKGCWVVGQSIIGQWNRQTWDIGVEMTSVKCEDYSSVYYSYWHFRVQLQQGQLGIISIGLYPTAPAK